VKLRGASVVSPLCVALFAGWADQRDIEPLEEKGIKKQQRQRRPNSSNDDLDGDDFNDTDRLWFLKIGDSLHVTLVLIGARSRSTNFGS